MILGIFVILLLLKTAAELILDQLNYRHVQANADSIPSAFAGMISEEKYAKSVAYTKTRLRFSSFDTVYSAIILAILVFTGLLPAIWYSLEGVFGIGVWGQAMTLISTMVVLSLPGLPLDYYNQFVIEERFGFNRSSVGLWITDKVKGIGISLVLGLPIVALILWLAQAAGELWWVWAFAAFFAFQLLMMFIVPMFIMPLFNKFEPLEDGMLRKRLLKLADKLGFQAQTILVMDGSKRSGHSNAFFTGFGGARRVVLFDTLIEQLDDEELEAVLAHEIGHYKLKHIQKMLIFAAVAGLAGFYALALLADSAAFMSAFGFETVASLAPVILLFSLVADLVTFWLSPLSGMLSRKHEYEADAFAKDAVADEQPLVTALQKLQEENLSNLTPHPVYSSFYYSHPTLVERKAALEGTSRGDA